MQAGLVEQGFSRDAFAGLLGQQFYLYPPGARAFWASLVEVSEPLPTPDLEQFSILLRVPFGRAREGLHKVWNQSTDSFPLYLTPAGSEDLGQYQQAIFNLLR